MQLNSTACEISVLNFITTERDYYFMMSDGRRADIIKCRPFQPAIADHDHYHSYLWVNSTQGYFVLSQYFLGGQAEDWKVILEVTPPDSIDSNWFDDAGDALIEKYSPA